MIIVAFGHRQRVGKDTAAKFLLYYLRCHQISCAKLSFGDFIRAECSKLYSWAGMQDPIFYENHPEYVDRQLAPLGKTPRQVWLEFGHYLSEIHPATICEIALTNADAKVLVCPSLRRAIEIDYVKKFNGLLVKIDRDDVPKVESMYQGHPAYMMDSTLESFDGWDYKITNNGLLRDLNKAVEAIGEAIVRRLDVGTK